MGRHSASDDDDDLLERGSDDPAGDSGLALLDEVDDEPRGRHAFRAAPTAVLDRLSAPTAADVSVTDTAPVTVVRAPLAEPPATAPATAAAPSQDSATAEPVPTRTPAGTKADLALLRTDSGLRARAAAAVVVPILIYVVVLAAIGHLHVFVYWVWIPIIVAGVLFGLMLDLADRRPKATPAADAEPESRPPSDGRPDGRVDGSADVSG